MPYISSEKRPQYEELINNLLPPEKGFSMELSLMLMDLERLVEAWVSETTDPLEVPDRIGSILRILPKKPMDAAGHLNYVISSCIWRALGPDANYAARCWVSGTLENAKQNRINSMIYGTGLRSTLSVGIFSDVLHEMYRRQTAVYEDQKIAKHGDII